MKYSIAPAAADDIDKAVAFYIRGNRSVLVAGTTGSRNRRRCMPQPEYKGAVTQVDFVRGIEMRVSANG